MTRNPWNPDRTPGGSSGGTAAAVSVGAIPFGTASDGGGSIRGPAASCGLPGLKPTFGRVPTFGVTRHAGNAVNFALATTVADTALLFDIAAGPDMRDRTSLPPAGISYLDAIEQLDVAGLRAAWSPDLGFATTDPEVVAITERAATTLVDAAGLVDSGVDVQIDDFIRIYAFMESADQFVDVPDDWEDRLDELDPLVVGGWQRNRTVTLPQFAKVEKARRGLELQVASLFDHIDVLLTPTNPCAPVRRGGTDADRDRRPAMPCRKRSAAHDPGEHRQPAVDHRARRPDRGRVADRVDDHHRPPPRRPVPPSRAHLRAGRPLAPPRPQLDLTHNRRLRCISGDPGHPKCNANGNAAGLGQVGLA